MFYYPDISQVEGGRLKQSWRLTTTSPIEEAVDLVLFNKQIRQRSIAALNETLIDQGYSEMVEDHADLDLKVNAITATELVIDFVCDERRDAATRMAFITNACWVVEQMYGPIKAFEGRPREKWKLFPLPSPEMLAQYAQYAP